MRGNAPASRRNERLNARGSKLSKPPSRQESNPANRRNASEKSQRTERSSDADDDQRGGRENSESGRGDSGRSASGRDGRDGNRKDRDDDGPPKTVLELIKRMTAPSNKGRGVGDPGAAQWTRSEIVAVGLPPRAIAKARALGFGVDHSNDARVARLLVPPGLDALAARDLLRTELPGSRIGLNFVYRPYRSAGAETGEPTASARGVRRASAGGCSAERCYGPVVMGWQPHLRSCSKNARIGIIDTSVDLDHPALKGRKIEVGNFLAQGAAPAVNGHGTGVLALLAGSPGSSTPGLVPDAHFFTADVYHADEAKQPVTDTASLLRALDWMRASRVNVINMSLSGPHDELLQKAIADLSSHGTLFVAAAGNGGPNAPPSYPAAYEQVIAVTAVDKDLRGYVHANHGDYIDVAAPGVDIWTALPNVLEGYQSGTSFAAPHVTAILATIYGQVRGKNKEAFLQAVAIRDLGRPGRDRVYGRGLVAAPAACSGGEEQPGGWITSVVPAPAFPTAVSADTMRPAAFK